MGRHVVCRVDEIPEQAGKLVRVAGRDLAVFNLGDRFAAVVNRCPHEGADLCKGRVAALVTAAAPGAYVMEDERVMVRCPWHGWEFDLMTGRSYCSPDRLRVKTFDVAVSPGIDLVEGPYEIEVFKVEAEGEYVVVTV